MLGSETLIYADSKETFHATGARRVLDAAYGTGVHAIALVQVGFETVGADLSDEMISRARENAESAGLDIPF